MTRCSLIALLCCTTTFFFAPALRAVGDWQSLFDGKSLDGWQANQNPGTWTVQDGSLVTSGPTSHLFYVGPVSNHTFKNFEFSAEAMTTPGSNSGIYIHTHLSPETWPPTGYECQVINSSHPAEGQYSEHKMTGSIYAVRNTWRTPAPDNTWFEYRIRVSGKTIQTFIDGELVCQYTEGSDDWRASDKQGRRLSSGTFALQGHDPKSVVRYRNVRVRLLPDDAPSLDEPLGDRELDELIGKLSDQNYALIDFGIEPGTASLTQAQTEAARRYGMTLSYTLPSEFRDVSHLSADGPIVVVNDRDAAPSVALLKAAKANGARIIFTSGGVHRLDPDRLKKRFHAILDAGLSWRDLWTPGK